LFKAEGPELTLQFQSQDSEEAAASASQAAAETFAEFRAALERRLVEYLEGVRNEVATIAPEASPVVEQVRVLTLRGGKRLRAGFVLAGVETVAPWRSFSPAILDVCVALELFQSYLLIHDDWMDGDSVRRAGPTVHVALGEMLGDAQQGAAAAVLAGDLASGLAQSVLCGPSLRAEQVQRLMGTFTAMQRQVMFGQTLDLLGTGDLAIMNDLKTSSYTVRGPLALAAALVGIKPTLCTTFDAYAKPLGLAFQLRDDVLGAFGNMAETGKGPFTDLEKRKQTAVLVRAVALLPAAEGAALRRLLGTVGEEARAEARQLLSRAGERDVLEAEIAACCEQALAALEGAELRAPGRHLLQRLATLSSHRSS
jgi:geranylgeranyl diphosphate synthase, type I